MEDINNQIGVVLDIVMLFVVLIAISIHAYFTYRAVSVGIKKGFNPYFLLLFCFLFSPIAPYAFMMSAPKHTEIVKVKYKNNENNIVETTLTTIIEEKIPKEKIIEVKNINAFCQYCQTNFAENIYNCLKCNKKRVWYYLIVKDLHTSQKIQISIDQWKKLPNDSIIKDLGKRKNPFV